MQFVIKPSLQKHKFSCYLPSALSVEENSLNSKQSLIRIQLLQTIFTFNRQFISES